LTDTTNSDQPSIAQSLSTFYSSLNNVPLVHAIQSIATSLPSGLCPAPTFHIFGASIVMDIQCTIYSQIEGILSAIFLAMWAWAGIKIIMSA